jgi:hypothetical protein
MPESAHRDTSLRKFFGLSESPRPQNSFWCIFSRLWSLFGLWTFVSSCCCVWPAVLLMFASSGCLLTFLGRDLLFSRNCLISLPIFVQLSDLYPLRRWLGQMPIAVSLNSFLAAAVDEELCSLPVVGGTNLEVCLAQFWSRWDCVLGSDF